MAGAPALPANVRIDALSVVADPQSKLRRVIVEFHFDPRRVCVPETITQRLTCNPVDFVPERRRELPGCALHSETKIGAILTGLIGTEFFSDGADRPGQVVGSHGGGAQALHRIAAFDDCALRLFECAVESFDRLLRAVRKHIAGRLKPEHQALKTLEESVV